MFKDCHGAQHINSFKKMEREPQNSYRNLGGSKEEYVNSKQVSVHSIGYDK